jgi:hypothetical protein
MNDTFITFVTEFLKGEFMNLFEKYQKRMEMIQAEDYNETRNESNKTSSRYAVRIYSEILGAFLWIVQDQGDMTALRARGVEEAVYTGQDIHLLKGKDREHLRDLQAVKTVFPDSTIEDERKG